MRNLVLLPMAALILASPASAPQLAFADTRGQPALDADAICAPYLTRFRDGVDQRYGGGIVATGQRINTAPSAMAAPPPPPPPAPPPPPVTVVTGDQVVLQGPQQTADMINSLPQLMMEPPEENRERYDGKEVATVQAVVQAPVSTFSVDVDTGSYANVRRMLTGGAMPPQGAVRTEEMLNYFRYDYPAPQDRARPFTITADMTTTPWNAETRLLRVGLRGYDLPRAERPPANLVFLVDVSGSMHDIDKLPLVQCSLALLAERLAPQDRVSIVVYAGAAGRVLAPTADKKKVVSVLSQLEAGGSTAGAEGIQLAYKTARENRIHGGINRVILATDGDFNVGVSDNAALVDMVEREREAGITLTTLGFGEGNYNEAMMEQIADHGNGNYAYIDSPREAGKVLDQELSSTLFTIAKDVKIQVEFNPAYVREYRLIGYENRTLAEQDFDNDKVDAGDIGAGHQVTALYELVPVGAKGWLPDRHFAANRGEAGGSASGELAWLRLRYKLPDGDKSLLIEQPVHAALVQTAAAPSGDTAFAAAVAAFGQRLRGDPWLGRFGFGDARRLAERSGRTGDYWRLEFGRLTQLAERQPAGSARGSE
ncbi:MAG TPA: VWA domain-containing protein [Allosphingosinicella sp.]|jgi:Ca-activated chloride channel family protein